VKKIILALVVAVATAAAASAQTAAKQAAPAKQPAKTAAAKAAPQAKAKAAPAAKAMSTKGEVVSTDAAAKTITVKDDSGASVTYTATGTAAASLAKLAAGDHVTVWHNDTTATKIVKAKATTTAKKTPKSK
jgi:glucose/arabinose dehydrogenase